MKQFAAVAVMQALVKTGFRITKTSGEQASIVLIVAGAAMPEKTP
ncbi:hypothetical protein [Streptomyces beigongshangae]|nr:hypothetical protein [Streptomyces sp. REN17]